MTINSLVDSLVRRLMLVWPVYPDINKPRSGPRIYVNSALASEEAEAVYEDEFAYPFDHYFGHELELAGKSVLDLGCYCGGRAVAWAERYKLARISGIDVSPAMAEAGNCFAARRGIDAAFKTGTGESIPFPANSFDAILTFDVLEHVRDVRRVLAESYRVLKPGGKMYLVFPQFLNPVEHHLSSVTHTPCLHYFFRAERLLRVYNGIIQERGSAAWYARPSLSLAPWEKGHTINGTSIAEFDRIVTESGFDTLERIDPALFTVGRRAGRSRSVAVKIARYVCRALVHVPGVNELLTHRIVRVLEKPAHCAGTDSESNGFSKPQAGNGKLIYPSARRDM